MNHLQYNIIKDTLKEYDVITKRIKALEVQVDRITAEKFSVKLTGERKDLLEQLIAEEKNELSILRDGLYEQMMDSLGEREEEDGDDNDDGEGDD